MIGKERIIEALFSAIDEVNLLLHKDQRLRKSVDVVLSGASGELDSLGLVNLIVATEEKVEEEFSVPISLTDKRAMSQRDAPFRTVGTLVDYVSSLLNENTNE